MNSEEFYKNGQKVYEQDGDILTYYFKSGIVRAKGKYINEMMEGEWLFYRGNGDLWQVGNFKNNQKHGPFLRYDKQGQEEYNAVFEDGKLVSKK